MKYLEGENVRASPERDGIRVSFAMFNTADEVDRLAHIIARGMAAGIGRTRQSSTCKP
jgi:selenocysteine lyase/cysteine desulfurase